MKSNSLPVDQDDNPKPTLDLRSLAKAGIESLEQLRREKDDYVTDSQVNPSLSLNQPDIGSPHSQVAKLKVNEDASEVTKPQDLREHNADASASLESTGRDETTSDMEEVQAQDSRGSAHGDTAFAEPSPINPEDHSTLVSPVAESSNGSVATPGNSNTNTTLPAPRTQPQTTAPLTTPATEPSFTVTRLLGKRTRKGEEQYLVQWQGYPKSQATWEPSKMLREDMEDDETWEALLGTLPRKRMRKSY
jgi:hypothetical protein